MKNTKKNQSTIEIAENSIVYIFSDTHITTNKNLDDSKTLNKLIEELDKIEKKTEKSKEKTILIFLGDFLDLIREDITEKSLKKEPYIKIFNKIKDIRLKGSAVYYVLGNHDRLLLTNKPIVNFLESKEIEINRENPYSLILEYKDNSIVLEHGNQYDPLAKYNKINYKYERTISDEVVNILRKAKKNDDFKGKDWIKNANKVRPISKLPNWFFSKFFYYETSKSFKILSAPLITNYLLTRLLPLLLLIYILFWNKIKISEIPKDIVTFAIVLIIMDLSYGFLFILFYLIKKDTIKVLKKFNLFDFNFSKRKDSFYTEISKNIKENRTYFTNNIKNLRLIILGHKHSPELKKINNKYLMINGCWLKHYDSVKSLIMLPRVFYEVYELNYITIEFNKLIKAEIHEVRISSNPALTFLEKVSSIHKWRKIKRDTHKEYEHTLRKIEIQPN